MKGSNIFSNLESDNLYENESRRSHVGSYVFSSSNQNFHHDSNKNGVKFPQVPDKLLFEANDSKDKRWDKNERINTDESNQNYFRMNNVNQGTTYNSHMRKNSHMRNSNHSFFDEMNTSKTRIDEPILSQNRIESRTILERNAERTVTTNVNLYNTSKTVTSSQSSDRRLSSSLANNAIVKTNLDETKIKTNTAGFKIFYKVINGESRPYRLENNGEVIFEGENYTKETFTKYISEFYENQKNERAHQTQATKFEKFGCESKTTVKIDSNSHIQPALVSPDKRNSNKRLREVEGSPSKIVHFDTKEEKFLLSPKVQDEQIALSLQTPVQIRSQIELSDKSPSKPSQGVFRKSNNVDTQKRSPEKPKNPAETALHGVSGKIGVPEILDNSKYEN